jgi:hypothetical protein
MLNRKDKDLSKPRYLEQVPPEMENRKFFACFISGDTFSINTLLIH